MAIVKNFNEETRQAWVSKTLQALPAGVRILDGGAGELKNLKYCDHLDYVSQDFFEYQGAGGASGRGFTNQGLG